MAPSRAGKYIQLPLCTVVSFLAMVALPGGAGAGSLQQPADAEASETERVLKELVAKEPSRAAEVNKAVEEANKPVGRREERGSRRERARRIVNGRGTFDFPAAGALLKGADRRSAQAWCSGTLVGCDKFLTAAHCVAEDPTPGNYKVFFQHAGFFDVRDIQWFPGYRAGFPDGDIAVLSLAQPVPHIAPMQINRIAKPADGVDGRIVGFGRTGGANYDYGLKREGLIRTASCKGSLSNETLVCWNFNTMVSPKDSNTCNADSGGGLYIQEGRTTIVAGTTIAGWREDCLSGDHSYDANVFFYYVNWLKSLGVGAISGQCGSGTFIDTNKHVLGTTDTLSDVKTEVTYPLDVGAGTGKLSVAMNSEDDGNRVNDFDLYLIQGAGADIQKAVCTEDGPGQFGYCEVNDPMPGPWRIIVKRKRGQGAVQVAVTQLPR
jgi:hypothetical protein